MSPWCDICGPVAGYGLVNVACSHITCHTSDTLTSNRTRSPPQVNDALTPRACQALLAYTFTLGEPVRCIPLFLQCLRSWSVTVIEHSTLDLALGTSQEFSSDRVSAEILLHSTPPMHSLAFRIPDQSQCTQTFQA